LIFRAKEKYDMNDLLAIMRLLRSPEGCPWDREQDHHSIRSNFIEEVYEAVDAMDANDKPALCEELGDVLLQVAFHAQMEAEQETFSFDDVCDGICKKLIHRHPHIFSDVVAETSGEVLRNWDAIKKKEKGQKTQTDTMQSVPRCFPALMRAEKVQNKAAKVGFDWEDVRGPLDKLREETNELSEALENKDSEGVREELGDVLFAAVNVSRFVSLDAEETLTRATDKFIARFARVERLASEKGMDMKTLPLVELDRLWDKAKEELYSLEGQNAPAE